MKRYIFALASLFSYSSLSMATKTFDINLGDVSFPRDHEIGSTTNWKEVESNWTVEVLCNTMIWNSAFGTTGPGTMPLVPGYRDVYQTNQSGIGVRYKMSTWHNPRELLTVPFDSEGIACRVEHGFVTSRLRAAVQLVVIGRLPIGSVDFGTIRMHTRWNGVSREAVEIELHNVPPIKVSTCHVGGDVSVPMPSIGLHDLPSSGSTAGRTAFNIRMVCDPSIAVHMVMTDASNPGNTGNVLALGADSKATGVGYQILHDSKPISFGPASPIKGALNQFKVVDSTGAAGGQYSIPFHAQYYRTTSSPPRAGNANAKATFTMSYQ